MSWTPNIPFFNRRKYNPELNDEEYMAAKDQGAVANALSIKRIPAALIADDERAAYLARALAGQDVYAYRSADPTREFWNLWDSETRIALPPVEKVWHIVAAVYQGESRWQIVVERGTEQRTVGFWVHHHPQYDRAGEAAYQARAPRCMKSVVNHCGAFDIDPAKFQDTHQ